MELSAIQYTKLTNQKTFDIHVRHSIFFVSRALLEMTALTVVHAGAK